MYVIRDNFTTQDGRWDRHTEPYDISVEDSQQYGVPEFKSKGCATCIFVRIEDGPGAAVEFNTSDGNNKYVGPADDNGWADMTMFHSSAYNPSMGEKGPWRVKVEGFPSELYDGIGLPFSWHVSTFVVFGWVEQGNGPVDPVDPEPDPNPGVEGQWVQLYLDGILVFERNNPSGTA